MRKPNIYFKLKHIFFLLLVQTTLVSAQQNQYLKPGDSDPEAIVVLNDMSDKLAEWGTVEIKFSFEYLMTDGSKILEDGTILQRDDKFRFEMGEQLVVSDGNYQWYYIKKRNEVQINDFDGEGQQMSPTYFLNFHRSGEYVFAITNQSKAKNGHTIVRVDFKPINDFSEYSKIGLDLDKDTNLPVSMLVVLKEGGRYIFKDLHFSSGKNISDQSFGFDASKYPGIYIEDLRLD